MGGHTKEIWKQYHAKHLQFGEIWNVLQSWGVECCKFWPHLANFPALVTNCTELSGLMAQSWNAKMFSLSFWYLISVSPDIIGSETFKKQMSRALCEKSVRRQIIISSKRMNSLWSSGKGRLPVDNFGYKINLVTSRVTWGYVSAK